jgi:hypothetical protein
VYKKKLFYGIQKKIRENLLFLFFSLVQPILGVAQSSATKVLKEEEEIFHRLNQFRSTRLLCISFPVLLIKVDSIYTFIVPLF